MSFNKIYLENKILFLYIFPMLKIISFTALIIYFAVLLFVVVKEKKNHSTFDYFFAGRTLPFWALSITFVASWWGAGSAIETADSAYHEGLGAFWIYGMPVLVSTFVMILGSAFIRRIGYLTQGEMVKVRYSKTASKMLSVMILLFMTLNAATQMVGVGNIFSAYLGIDYTAAVILGTSIVIIYSMFGGFRGVVITDLIQFFLLFFSALAVLLTALHFSGGYEAVSEKALSKGYTDFFSFSAGAEKNLVFVITFGLSWVIQANVWQRISAARNDKDSTKMAVMSFFIYIPLYLMVVVTGMAALSLFDSMPKGGVIAGIVTEYMNPFLGALVFLGLSAAVMSTMDSLINTGAMTIGLDLAGENLTDKKRLFISRVATLVISLIAVIIAVGIKSILQISFVASDIITSGVFIPLVMGFFWKRGNSYGAVASMVFGVVFSFYNLAVKQGLNLPTFWEVQSAAQAIWGITLSAVIYITVSLLSKPDHEKANVFLKGNKEN